MKPIMKMLLVVLAAGACGMPIFLLARTSNWQEVNRPSPARPVRETSGSASIPIPVPANTAQTIKPKPSDTTTNVLVPIVAQSVSTTPALPIGIGYNPITSVNQSDVLLPILSAVSNAVLTVDRILKSQNYSNVVQFGRTVWLESTDRAQLTVWRISPYRTNAVVGGIKAIVYQDDVLTQKDPARSFQMEFYPETGTLRDFWWDDNHEVLLVLTNGVSDYGRDLGGKMGLVMRWDDKGNLVSSNVYNWATRGQPIEGIKPEVILPAQVTLKPEALEVSPGILTAFVRLPEGFPASGITTATCDYASAERMMLNDDKTEMIMKFRRQDIEAALARVRESIDTNFVVSGTWQGPVGTYLFQGADSIKKIVGAKEK